jgi:hypothetical protein
MPTSKGLQIYHLKFATFISSSLLSHASSKNPFNIFTVALPDSDTPQIKDSLKEPYFWKIIPMRFTNLKVRLFS